MLLATAGHPSHSGTPAHPPLHPYIHSCRAHTVSGHRDCLWLLATYHPESGTLSHIPGGCLSAPTPHRLSPSDKIHSWSFFLKLSQTAFLTIYLIPTPPSGGGGGESSGHP